MTKKITDNVEFQHFPEGNYATIKTIANALNMHGKTVINRMFVAGVPYIHLANRFYLVEKKHAELMLTKSPDEIRKIMDKERRQ